MTDEEKARVRGVYETRAREGEQVELATCPHCGVELAIFISDVPSTEPPAPEPSPAD